MTDTVFDNRSPGTAEWYYIATIVRHGETDYIDGYASGDRPTIAALQNHSKCRHSWVAGMMAVHDEDAESIAAIRPVTCEKCECSYADQDKDPLNILEFTVKSNRR